MATQINAFYQQHAMAYAEISDDWMTFTLPSEEKADVSYEVQCGRIASGVEVVSCQCHGFEYRGHCKHLTIVQDWIEKVIMSSQGICEVEAGKWYIVNSDTQVWLQDGKWVAAGPTENAIEIVERHLEKQKEVTPVVEEPAIETPDQVAAIEETPVVEKATEEVKVEPKPTYRIISLGQKKERRDLLAEIEAKRESKFEMLGEIAEIKERKRAEDRMMAAPLTTNQGFRLMR